MRDNGQTTLPPPNLLPSGQSISLPSREGSRTIPCRLFYPNDNSDKKACKGIILHIHGGGWVLNTESSQDVLLKEYADTSGCVVISVGYRLAPENTFPAANDDCADVAEYLVDKGEEEYGGKLSFIGGESAGGHLALTTTFHLLRTRPNFTFLGLLLHFGCYDVTIPRSTLPHPILSHITYQKFIEAFVPESSHANLPNGKQNPAISPFYEDLEQWRGKLPNALFTCGSVDILLHDTVLMSAKWMMAGGEAMTKIYSGGVHGYIFFPKELSPQAKKGMEETITYIKERLATVG